MSAFIPRRLGRHGSAALLCVLAACYWGPEGKDFAPAMSPAGVRVAVRVRGETADRVGELYAADTTGLILRAQRLVRVRWADVGSLDVLKLGKGYDVRSRHSGVDAAHQGRLAVVSRFPQGLSEPLLTRVLALLGQPSLDEVR